MAQIVSLGYYQTFFALEKLQLLMRRPPSPPTPPENRNRRVHYMHHNVFSMTEFNFAVSLNRWRYIYKCGGGKRIISFFPWFFKPNMDVYLLLMNIYPPKLPLPYSQKSFFEGSPRMLVAFVSAVLILFPNDFWRGSL